MGCFTKFNYKIRQNREHIRKKLKGKEEKKKKSKSKRKPFTILGWNVGGACSVAIVDGMDDALEKPNILTSFTSYHC